MSYCLRHNPDKYGLKLDEYGFVDLQEFLKAEIIKSVLCMVIQFLELLNADRQCRLLSRWD